jgi:signal transduction histidine kinase
MRNVEEVFSALKENLDQILGNLQDGILLFTETARGAGFRGCGAVSEHRAGQHAGPACAGDLRPLDGAGPGPLRGLRCRRVADSGRDSDRDGRRIQVSLDFIFDDKTSQGLGALLTLHDLESAEAIESELELSRRMAAIGRLTSGVGHEVKNPINAIVVHVELLKSKLSGAGVPATRHLEIIEAEIHRLDRVVQLLVDFSRPVELRLREQDLREVIDDVLVLSAAELSTHNVTLESRMPAKPLMVNIDADLLKQAR